MTLQIQLTVSPATLQLFVEGLAKLPYERVASTIDQLVEIHRAAVAPPKPKRRRKAAPAKE